MRHEDGLTRRDALRRGAGLATLGLAATAGPADAEALGPRPHVHVRGVYGGIPAGLREAGINAVWIGSGGLNADRVAEVHAQGARLFAEFNSMHVAEFVKAHPDAAPVGPDGAPCPAPDGWQGACPTHPGYRADRMAAFRKALAEHEVDGIWLDYHHAHASWEQAEPNLPDTCFCGRCLERFARETGTAVEGATPAAKAATLLGERRASWVAWRCGVFADWVREYKGIRDAVRPKALLGTFHCPWTDAERDGALRAKLAIDLKAQAPLLDVLSPMPYHARFGHAADPGWIARQVAWLGDFLGIRGEPGERLEVWPIVQLADWGERVPPDQVETVIDHATRRPARGVTVFAWGGLRDDPEKRRRLAAAYRALGG
jgi:hypothetical protein